MLLCTREGTLYLMTWYLCLVEQVWGFLSLTLCNEANFDPLQLVQYDVLLQTSSLTCCDHKDRAAVKRPLRTDKDVGSNPAAAKRKTDIEEPPSQKVAQWSRQDLSGRLVI